MDALESGHARLGGIDASEHDGDELRAVVRLERGDGHLFAGSIGENVRLARPEASGREVDDALARAGAAPWIAELPDHGSFRRVLRHPREDQLRRRSGWCRNTKGVRQPHPRGPGHGYSLARFAPPSTARSVSVIDGGEAIIPAEAGDRFQVTGSQSSGRKLNAVVSTFEITYLGPPPRSVVAPPQGPIATGP